MKVNLGCGNKKISGYVNVDIREDVNPDIIDDVSKLEKFKNESIDLIYACHILEHFGRHKYKEVLTRWYSVLKPDGVLRLAIPNFEKICEVYSKNKNMNELLGLLYGGQNYEQNFHYCIWDFNSIKKDLIDIGFKEINYYNWEETEHYNIDDYSQAYLPHMDKKNGTLMSLNIEAKK